MPRYHDLPDWDDEQLRRLEEENEIWGPNPTREACKALYQQWQQVVYLLNAAFATITEEEGGYKRPSGVPLSYWEETALSLLNDAMIAAVRIRSSESGALYILRMEHAAIIRKCASDIRAHLNLFANAPGMEQPYIDILREEIDKFRELFKAWVGSFRRDEFEDEWGLFV